MKTYAVLVDFTKPPSFRMDTDAKSEELAKEAVLEAARRSGYEAPVRDIKTLEVM